MNTARANVDQALLGLLTAISGWQIPPSMHFRPWEGQGKVDASDQPCCFLRRISEDVSQSQAYGLNKYVLHYEIWIYAQVDSKDSSVNPYDTLDVMVDSVDNALAPNPAMGRNNLSGLVDNCRINGPIYLADGVDNGQAVIRIPVEVFTGQ
jgi:hypothetical protein